MSSVDSLTSEQQEKYQLFLGVTNWEGDPQLPIQLLTASNWDVEMAVGLHLDASQGPPNASGPSLQQSQSALGPEIVTSSLMEELHQPAEDIVSIHHSNGGEPITYQVQDRAVLSFIQTIITYPFSIGYKLLSSLFYLLSSIFPFLPRLTGYYPANRTATRSIGRLDSKSTALRIIRSFEEAYGSTGLKFFEGSSVQAYNQAKTNFKFLVIILLSDEHDLTAPFNRQVLTDSRVVELLNRKDVIVWLGNIENTEGLLVAESLKCTTFPVAELIAPFPKTPTSMTLVMKTLATVEGETDPMKFISTFEDKMEAHHPVIMSLVLDRQERERDRELREEQNAAYERSLAADRERERLQREEVERVQREEQARVSREEELRLLQEEREKNEKQWKLWRIAQLGSEFEGTDEKPARISVRLPSGERIVRKFSPHQTLDDIYAFVECYDLIKEGNLPNQNIDLPLGYIHSYRFALASTLPRKTIPSDPTILIKDDNSVWPSASLIVEIEESDDE